jgi:hypothetical protein
MNSSVAIVTKELVQVPNIKSEFNNMMYKVGIKTSMVETARMCPPAVDRGTPFGMGLTLPFQNR